MLLSAIVHLAATGKKLTIFHFFLLWYFLILLMTIFFPFCFQISRRIYSELSLFSAIRCFILKACFISWLDYCYSLVSFFPPPLSIASFLNLCLLVVCGSYLVT